MKEKIGWIDNTKLMACLFIMMAHLESAAINSCTTPPASSPIFDIFHALMMPLETGKMWVMIFCILSGMLSSKRVSNLKELCVECAFRYLRFFIPLFLCNLLLVFLSSYNLFFHHSYGTVYGSSWLLTCYPTPYHFSNLLRDTVLLGSAPGSPPWTIRLIFVGNVLILVVNYITNHLSNHQKLAVEGLTMAALCLLFRRHPNLIYVAAVFSGLIFADTKRTLFSPKVIPFLIIPAFSMYYLPIFSSFPWVDSTLHYWLTALIFTFGFVYSGYRGKCLTSVNLSSVSFWIYMLHWPFICSVCMWLLLHLPLPFWYAYGITALLLAASMLGISILLSKTLDVWLQRVLKTCKQKLLM